ncbi:MAG: lipopolysaccharide biosynthesis protein [Chryseobacterium sp.]|nr:lipopolysaccharide biosynthesis protein [Chryseobacterium sp.]
MINNSQLYKGLVWSAIDKLSIVVIQFVFEIIMARILSPKEYGVMGMLLVVMSFTQIFIDGGFGSALIYNKDRTEKDFATAFYTSALLGIIIYIILYFISPYLSAFYNKDITLFIRVIGIGIILNSLSVIYKTRLTIVIDFQSQAKFSFLAVLLSGIVGILLAYFGYGVWALIIQNVTLAFFNLIFLCVNLKWFPSFIYSKDSFLKMFGYGSKLLYAAIINAVYMNFNSIILGKYFSTKALGIYTKSSQLTINPISILTGIIQRVFFPYMVKFQSNFEQLYDHNNKYNRLIFLILLPFVTVVILYSDVLIELVLSDKWLEMVLPFNILLVSILFYPIIVMNMNIFQVIGKTSKFLFVEILTKIVGLGIIFFFYKYGLLGICFGILVQFIVQYVVTSFFVANSLKKNFSRTLDIFLYLIFASALYLICTLVIKRIENSFLRTSLTIIIIIAAYSAIYYKLYGNQLKGLYSVYIKKMMK